MKFWFCLGLLAKLGDLLTTTYFVNRWGVQLEGNPLVRYSMETLGVPLALAVNGIAFCLLYTLFYWKQKKTHMKIVSTVMVGITLWNILFILMMSGVFLKFGHVA